LFRLNRFIIRILAIAAARETSQKIRRAHQPARFLESVGYTEMERAMLCRRVWRPNALRGEKG
jgi:hypothetical protein